MIIIKRFLIQLRNLINNIFQEKNNKASLNPDEQKLGMYWENDFADILETWGEAHVWNEIQLLCANCKGTILDIACGTGAAIKKLQSNPHLDVYGFDISDLLINRAVQKGINSDKLKVTDATKTDYDDSSFDYSYSIGSLEHFTEDGIDCFIKETFRYTKTASFHQIPISKSGENHGWITTSQSYFNNNEDWWLQKFKKYYPSVQIITSGWQDNISIGKWFLCFKD
ncbi:MAG: class I SAM-dependent methyltransferase [Bacteroidota bacterium]